MSLELEEITGVTGDVFEDFLVVFRRCLAKVIGILYSIAGQLCVATASCCTYYIWSVPWSLLCKMDMESYDAIWEWVLKVGKWIIKKLIHALIS